jgi:membrane-bound serine protease (ClpP class)
MIFSSIVFKSGFCRFVRMSLPAIIGLLLCHSQVTAQLVTVVDIDGSINPVSADYLKRAIHGSASESAECIVIRLNTPGGLLSSTRSMVTEILQSRVPVIVFVSPYGARAGSAGVFITMAGHIAAMAPGTNIGAAHPVSSGQMDSVMNEKATNDAAAFIRTIAQHRNRDTVWAEQSVRESVSITAREALDKDVINLMATNLPDLLRQVNGQTIQMASGSKTLRTSEARIRQIEMTWMERLLNIIVDPNIAYILMMIGIYGIMFELYSPGTIFPGVVGVISLILAFYAMQSLPVNYAGLGLIFFALLLFILEIKITSYGMLTIGGIIALVLGSMILLKQESPLDMVRISGSVIIPAILASTLFFGILAFLGIRAQKAPVVTGSEAIAGRLGFAQGDFEEAGFVQCMGETWQARSNSGPIRKGQQVRVTGREGFVLMVEKVIETI